MSDFLDFYKQEEQKRSMTEEQQLELHKKQKALQANVSKQTTMISIMKPSKNLKKPRMTSITNLMMIMIPESMRVLVFLIVRIARVLYRNVDLSQFRNLNLNQLQCLRQGLVRVLVLYRNRLRFRKNRMKICICRLLINVVNRGLQNQLTIQLCQKHT